MIRGKEYLLQLFLLCLIAVSCSSGVSEVSNLNIEVKDSVKVVESQPSIYDLETKVGAASIEEYLSLIKDKRVAIVGNQTSVINSTFLVDTLISLGVDIRILFAPEHGFRGDHGAGDHIKHGVDSKTGLEIFSLHGKTKKPTKGSLDSVDVILFDIQDVGARFYTYISTLHYVMEAAAENDKKVIVLDRPNPNAHYVDGPVLDTNYRSFIGMHPVPVVYGMTIGEYGKMINGEYWLKDSLQADYSVIKLKNWSYEKEYVLPIPPSPNLPNQLSIYLYPSLCFMEGTEVSLGRGTKFPFQVWGHPGADCDILDHFAFKPISIPEKCKYPKHENKMCRGIDFRPYPIDSIRKYFKVSLGELYEAQKCVKPNKTFFDRPDFFNLLAGNNKLIKDLKSKKPEEEIYKSWQRDLDVFKLIREKYLLYK